MTRVYKTTLTRIPENHDLKVIVRGLLPLFVLLRKLNFVQLVSKFFI